MDESARREWLTVAWGTLGHLPADLLAIGCRRARLMADHPSKIVPAIVAETEGLLAQRRQYVRDERHEERQRLESRPCSPEVAREIMEEFGIKPDDAAPPPPSPLRTPTRQDYIDLGVDPAVLDSMDKAQ